MRVCILNDNFYRGSGITLVIRRLAQTDSFKALDLYLAGCASVKGTEMAVEDTAIVPSSHFQTFNLMSSGPALLPALLRFARWLKEMHIDVLHVHHRRLAVLAAQLQPFTGVPVVFTGHLTFAPAVWFRWLSPRVATGVSPSVVRYIERCTRAREVHLMYNPQHFPLQLPVTAERPLRVLSVGRLEPVKAHATLIQAWALLQRRGCRAELDIYGEGPLRASLEALIVANGLQSHVRLLGFAHDLPERIPTYSFNVLVSEREGFPNVVVEAASGTLPSLVTDVDGSRDTLPKELLLPNALPFGNVEVLSTTLQRWLTDPDAVREDGARFYHHLQKRCDPEVVAQQYVTLYRKLSSRRAVTK